MSFEPLQPFGNTARVDWARKMQEAAYLSRRVNVSNGMLIHQTTHGVFINPKPADVTPSETTPADFFTFRVKWFLPNGANPMDATHDVILFDEDNGGLTHVEPPPADLTKMASQVIGGFKFPQSFVKLPRSLDDGWSVILTAYQNFYGNDTFDGGMVFPAFENRLSAILFVLPGQVFPGDFTIPVTVETFPIPAFQALANKNDPGFSTAWDPTATTSPPISGTGESSYLVMQPVLGIGNDGDNGQVFADHAAELYPPGTTLEITGVAWKE